MAFASLSSSLVEDLELKPEGVVRFAVNPFWNQNYPGIFLSIFKYLNYRDILRFSRVNKRFYVVGTSDLLWKQEVFKNEVRVRNVFGSRLANDAKLFYIMTGSRSTPGKGRVKNIHLDTKLLLTEVRKVSAYIQREEIAGASGNSYNALRNHYNRHFKREKKSKKLDRNEEISRILILVLSIVFSFIFPPVGIYLQSLYLSR